MEIICPFCKEPFECRQKSKFCSMGCAQRSRWKDHEKRFWSFVKKTRGCWMWVGSTAGTVMVYGRFRRSGERILAHRYSWELHNEPVPEGLLVLHTCDNTLCVRPDHLFLGTHKDNSQDMLKKGRANKARGERHGNSKLTEKKVRRIKEKYRRGDVTQAKLAEEFGVGEMQVSRIISGKRWAHLQG